MIRRKVSILASLALTLTFAGALAPSCTTSPPSNQEEDESGGTGDGNDNGSSDGNGTFTGGTGDVAFNDAGGTNGGNTGNTNGGNSGNTDGGNTGNTSGGNTGNTNGGSSGNSDGGGTGSDSCSVDTSFTGQIGADNTHGGGEVGSTSDLASDAGIQAVWDWIEQKDQDLDMWPEEDFDTDAREANVSIPEGEQVDVSGATVVATLFGQVGNQAFYIQDQNRAIEVDLGSAVSSGTPIKVGDKVSFTVTGVAVQNGLPQVYEISNFSKDSSGNPVPIMGIDSSGAAEGTDVHKLVRVGGKLTNANTCGEGYKCFDMVNQNGDVLVEFRAQTGDSGMGPSEGWCQTYVGPLGQFPGPIADADSTTLQVQANNFDWTP
jgi:hypothetical protein